MTLFMATSGGRVSLLKRYNIHILSPCYKTLEYEYNNCGILPFQDDENEIIFNLAIKGLGLCLKNIYFLVSNQRSAFLTH